MELFTLLTLPTTTPGAFSEYTPSASQLPTQPVLTNSSPRRKIPRLHSDDDITTTARLQKDVQTSAQLGPVKLVIANLPKRLLANQAQATNANDVSKEYTLVRKAINQVLDPEITNPTWTRAEIFEACHHVVLVEGKGQGLHNAVRLELRACTEKMARDILAASPEELGPIDDVVGKYSWFQKQVTLLSSLLTFLDQNYSPPNESTKELAYALFTQKIFESLEITNRLHNSLKYALTSERDSFNPSSPSDVKPPIPTSSIFSSSHELLAAFMSQLLTHGHYQSFEEGWISVTQRYFADESKECAEKMDDPQKFFVHVQKRIEQEEERMKNVMPSMSWVRTSQAVVNSLLGGRLDWLASVLPTYMTNKDISSLKSLYRLFARVDGTKILCSTFKADVVGRVIGIIKDTASEDTIVQRLLDLKQLCDDGIAQAFTDPKSSTPPSSSALDGNRPSTSTPASASTTTYIPNIDFTYAVTDAFTLGFKARRNKPAELVAKYINVRMRKGAGGDEDTFNREMDKVLEMHRFTDDKDVFRVFYQRMLAKRLLLERSASDDDEKRMLKKLTTEYDPEFGSGEQMFKDLAVSRTLMEQFAKDRASGKGSPTAEDDTGMGGFGAVVLQQSHWPISPSKIRLLLPLSMQSQLDTYTEFYKKQHKGRSLSWNHAYGTASLVGYFDEKSKELSVSMYQALVLLLFNESDQLAYGYIAENTGIPENELKPVLQSLALGKKRVLKKSPAGKDVLEGDMFRFNAGFTDPRPKIHINSIQAKETAEEQQRTESAIMDDRKHYLDAAIVRIMKAKKELSYNRIVEEAIQAVSKHFIPQPSDIKKRVENLVEQEYMERKEGVAGVYVYVA